MSATAFFNSQAFDYLFIFGAVNLPVSNLSTSNAEELSFRGKCVHELFEEQVARKPDAVALSFNEKSVTYGELDVLAEMFASRLRQYGVEAGVLVAIYAPRSLEIVIGLLAVLKAGGAYVALDMESPADRITSMLADAEPVVVLTFASLLDQLPVCKARLICLDDEINVGRDRNLYVLPDRGMHEAGRELSADDLAYVAFTSGSTGAPKGVCIPHKGVSRLAKAMDCLTVRPDDVFLQFAPIPFDASTFEIWVCLLNGARLAIFPAEKPSLDKLAEFIEREGVTVLWLTAGLFHQMAERHLHYLHGVRYLLTGGDVVSVPHVRKAMNVLPGCRVINGYGPTENTTFTCCHPVVKLPPEGSSLPIGKPVALSECLVLDEMQCPVTDGEPGELYVGGDGLATGYLKRPELTDRKFVMHHPPGGDAVRLYRTGDRVRRLPNGDYEFLGRMDRQVKVLGYRVELDEVEAKLCTHPAVSEASVILHRTIAGKERLAAFVVFFRESTATTAGLRLFLKQMLPSHMIPAQFVFPDSLPLRPNGKVNHDALLELCNGDCRPDGELPGKHGHDQKNTVVALTAIWREVLGIASIASSDDFFDHGGNSLMAVQLLSRIQMELHKNVPFATLVEHPTAESLAHYVENAAQDAVSPFYFLKSGGKKAALFCLPGHGGEMKAYTRTEPHFSGERPVYGLRSPGLLGRNEGQTMEEIAALHVRMIRSLRSDGPYHLLGFCFGGLLAFEVARQLLEQNATIGMLGIIQFDFHDLPCTATMTGPGFSIPGFLQNTIRGVVELMSLDREEREPLVRGFAKKVADRCFGHRKKMSDAEFRKLFPRLQDQQHATVSSAAIGDLFATHDEVWRHYVPKPIETPVTLFRTRRLPVLRPDPYLNWSYLKGQEIEMQLAPGPGFHGHLLKEPHVRELAGGIERSIAKAEERLFGK